jgi:hypothetical protein
VDLNTLKTDTNLAEEGVWVDIDPTTRLKVARYGNAKFRNKLRALMKPYERMIDNNTMDDGKADELLIVAVVDSVLLDWEGLERDGEALPYSKDTAKEILLDPALRDFREIVFSVSNELELFREKKVDDIVGES